MGAFTRPDDATLRALASRFGTPLWVYDLAVLDARIDSWRKAMTGLDHRICFAVKANGNLALLQHIATAGLGFDVVSVGELARVERAGGDPASVVFSGVGKRADEIDAALAAGVASINCESAEELETIAARAQAARVTAPIALRVNPGVYADTHPHIATGDHDDKFGVPVAEIAALARHAVTLPGIELRGLAVHIGSQLTDLTPVATALDRVLEIHDTLVNAGFGLTELDAGGGLGIRYRDESPPSIAEYGAMLEAKVGGRDLRVTVEPGRSLIGECGVLLAQVERVKRGEHHSFVVADAGMSELMRPALYGAWHPIEVVGGGRGESFACEVVGPLCESGDILGRAREMAAAAGDLLVVGCAGAYGASMSSRYNSRPAAAEVLLTEDGPFLARRRESIADQWRAEMLR